MWPTDDVADMTSAGIVDGIVAGMTVADVTVVDVQRKVIGSEANDRSATWKSVQMWFSLSPFG